MENSTAVNEQEEAFVRRFIVERKQERYLHFLSKPKTRGKFLSEFYHRLAIKSSLATELHPRDQTTLCIEQRLRAYGAGPMAYVISPHCELDGQWFALTGVISKIVGPQLEAVVCCLPGQLAFYRSEDGAYILHYQQPDRQERK